MLLIDPATTATKDLHQFMLGAVAPRPIAWASTIGADGTPNLAPYSFFNAFSSNPPILIFSSNRRVADNTTKDTLRNIEETGEVVINVVPWRLVRQMALTSVEFDYEVNEFEKAGLTPLKSLKIKPFRIAESPIQMECEVREIIRLGEKGGAGNLFVCHMVAMHIDEKVMDAHGRIDPDRLDLASRLGRAYYGRVKGEAIQTIVQGITDGAIGFDGLPEAVRFSTIFSGNDLGQLAGLPVWPNRESAFAFLSENGEAKAAFESKKSSVFFQKMAKKVLKTGDLATAAQLAALSAEI